MVMALPLVKSWKSMRWERPWKRNSMPEWTRPSCFRRSPTPISVRRFDGALLKDAGADAFLDVLAAAIFDDYGIDAFEVEKVRENQARGARADDSDLCALRCGHDLCSGDGRIFSSGLREGKSLHQWREGQKA